MVTKREMTSEIGMIEGLCKVINDETCVQNDLVCASIVQLHFGIEFTTIGDDVAFQTALLISLKNN